MDGAVIWMNDAAMEQRLLEMQPLLRRVAIGYLQSAEDQSDAVQECLYKAWKNRNQIRNDSFVQTWTIRILINECNNILRKRKTETALDIEDDLVAAPEGKEYGDLYDALRSLDVPLRAPVILHYLHGLCMSEISSLLRLPEGTVKGRLFRARKVLYEKLVS